MLRRLLRKDLILNGRVFQGLIWLFVWMCIVAGQERAVGLALLLGVVAATLMTVTLSSREDRFHATAVIYSLPVSRRDVVLQRYVCGYVVGALAFLSACLLMVALPWSKHTMAEVLDTRTVLLAVTTIGLMIATSMPLVLRFGAIGLFVGLGGLQLFGIAALAAGVVVGSLFALRPVVNAVEALIAAVHQSLGSGGYAAMILLAVGVATLVSYRLSLFLVERRDV